MINFDCIPINDDPTYKFKITGTEDEVEYELGRFRTDLGVQVALEVFKGQILQGNNLKQMAANYADLQALLAATKEYDC